LVRCDDAENTVDFIVQAALKELEAFPEEARLICLAALTIAATGGKADIAKPMTKGVKTPKREMDLIVERLNKLKEALR
jgi:phage-related protein